jgi:hypothetical protein
LDGQQGRHDQGTDRNNEVANVIQKRITEGSRSKLINKVKVAPANAVLEELIDLDGFNNGLVAVGL